MFEVMKSQGNSCSILFVFLRPRKFICKVSPHNVTLFLNLLFLQTKYTWEITENSIQFETLGQIDK